MCLVSHAPNIVPAQLWEYVNVTMVTLKQVQDYVHVVLKVNFSMEPTVLFFVESIKCSTQ